MWLQFLDVTVDVTANQEMGSLPLASEPISPWALAPRLYSSWSHSQLEP